MTLVRKFRDDLLGPSFLLVCLPQFHLNFYASRPLPNTYALILTNFAISFWYLGMWNNAIRVLAVVVCVLRCDIIVFAVALVLYDLCRGVLTKEKYTFCDFFFSGIFGSILGCFITVFVDSGMWGRLLWPELEMFWFNTYHNRSHEWGVSPFHWYFTSALPKSLSLAIPLIAIALFYKPKKGIIDSDV